MKKLMIAAAVAAMTAGAFAADCAETKDCPFGYQIKVIVKTTTSSFVNAYSTSDCKEEPKCVRVPATKRFAGFIYGETEKIDGQCGEFGCDCNEWTTSKLLLWNYDTKKFALPGAAAITQFDRILNGDTTTVELAFAFDKLVFAGFGKVATRNGFWTLKNASGFCAGQIPADGCMAECAETADAAACWSICAKETEAPDLTDVADTVAYGKWTIDWSATVYNRFAAGDSLRPGASWQWPDDATEDPAVPFVYE